MKILQQSKWNVTLFSKVYCLDVMQAFICPHECNMCWVLFDFWFLAKQMKSLKKWVTEDSLNLQPKEAFISSTKLCKCFVTHVLILRDIFWIYFNFTLLFSNGEFVSITFSKVQTRNLKWGMINQVEFARVMRLQNCR